MSDNKLVIAAAGSGKTTFLVQEALSNPDVNVLITTYTQSNEQEIRQKIISRRRCIPRNITVQTWFSFLLQHGVRPYQGSLNPLMYSKDVRGMLLVNTQSGIKYTTRQGRPVLFAEADDFERHYFTKDGEIFSDKVAKFVVKVDQQTDNAVTSRISRIYDRIFIDEVQDLAGYDLELIKNLFKSSSEVVLVGDPRQVTYLTHNDRKYRQYRNGLIKDFVGQELGRNISCEIDETTLNASHRNNESVCTLSSKLYPNFPATSSCACCNPKDVAHEGIFLVKPSDVSEYCRKYDVMQLRWSKSVVVDESRPVMSFGESKGKTLGHILIYLTEDMVKWMEDARADLKDQARAKFYVALTRAKYSVGIVMDYSDDFQCEDVEKWVREEIGVE